jgi:hypothetical protein
MPPLPPWPRPFHALRRWSRPSRAPGDRPPWGRAPCGAWGRLATPATPGLAWPRRTAPVRPPPAWWWGRSAAAARRAERSPLGAQSWLALHRPGRYNATLPGVAGRPAEEKRKKYVYFSYSLHNYQRRARRPEAPGLSRQCLTIVCLPMRCAYAVSAGFDRSSLFG